MLTEIGLIIVVLAWLYQLIKVASGNRSIQPIFAGLYVVGVGLLTIDAFMENMVTPALLNILAFVAASGVFLLLVDKRRADSPLP